MQNSPKYAFVGSVLEDRSYQRKKVAPPMTTRRPRAEGALRSSDKQSLAACAGGTPFRRSPASDIAPSGATVRSGNFALDGFGEQESPRLRKHPLLLRRYFQRDERRMRPLGRCRQTIDGVF